MSIITSVGIVAISMLIIASLQLASGIFALFFHYALGRFSKTKAANLAIFFIIGVEVITAFLFLAVYYLTCIIFFDGISFDNNFTIWLLIGVTIALGLTAPIFYFRRGNGTKLFIPRRYARALDQSAQITKTKSDAFLLGLSAGASELFFTLPLFMASSIAIIKLNTTSTLGNPFSLIFVLAPLVPLFVTYWLYRSGHNLADIGRLRTHNKLFIRFILCSGYLLLAILLIYSKVTIS